MKKNLVILGNQFLCEKRMLNIVQRTVIMDEDAIDVYIHNHQLFKDQRAIVVDPEIPVHTGHIFTGDTFIDPVNFTKTPIEGEVEEEEFDQKTSTSTTPEIVKWLENIMTEIRKITGGVGNVPRNHNEETRMNLIEKMNYINSIGSSFGRFLRPKLFNVRVGIVEVYKEASTTSDLIGYFKPGDNIALEGLDSSCKFALVRNAGYIEMNVRNMYVLGDVSKFITNVDDGVTIALVPEYIDSTNVIPYTVSEMREPKEDVTKSVTTPAENVEIEITVDEKTVGDEYSKEDKLRILIDEDYSVKDIAKEFNVNPSTIYKWMKKYNIKKSAD